ncbi:ABC transporter substrate-binding protein [Aureimonas psammosilenae]|uniref:ABC transporter substrate-binding protein n=1 Tax=Aureimonas psammosilenae TaxID=2495496 RepID=UPI001260FE9C|nr:sugar ABC transporter substrate-binding protein [Aureimonas psammosilenae]
MSLRNMLGALVACTTLAGASPALAAFDYGKFDGTTLKVKLIGGTQYEKLYTRTPEWEKLTGAKVEIVSSKNHFDLDREIKQDIAGGTINWCVASNHTSFAPQYGDIYIDLKEKIPAEELALYVPGTLKSAEIDGRLVQLPRVTDVSNLYYNKRVYGDPAIQTKYKEKFGTDLAPPKTYEEYKSQAIFLSSPPNLYGTAFPGKDEGMTGRFMELVRANGGDMFDENWNPTFNGPEGVAAVQWFVDLYKAKAVPAGTVNYTWDDIGQAFAAGTMAIDLDWPGFAAFYNNKETSKVAGDVGFAVAPVGASGKRGGWSGSHSFSVTKDCPTQDAAVSFVVFMTNYDSEMLEASAGNLPTRTKVFEDVVAKFKADGDTYMADMFQTWESSLGEARTPPLVPQWIEVSNVIWPQLQAAIVGEKSAKDALDQAANEARTILEDAGMIK